MFKDLNNLKIETKFNLFKLKKNYKLNFKSYRSY